MNLGEQFADIINDWTKELPMEEIGNVFVHETEENTKRGVQPDGSSFPPYSEFTNKSGTVNLRDRSRSVESVDTLYAQANEAIVGFRGDAGYGASSKPAMEVFYYHQEGVGRNPERRVFPDEIDETSSKVQSAFDRIRQILADNFNE